MINMLLLALIPISFAIGALAQVTFQNSSGTRLRVDNGTYGPEIEEVHYCKTGIKKHRNTKAKDTETLFQTMINGPSASP